MVYYFDSSSAVKRYAPEKGSDAVHLATAISLNTALLSAELPSLVFVSGDRILGDAARGEGLAVENPDEH